MGPFLAFPEALLISLSTDAPNALIGRTLGGGPDAAGRKSRAPHALNYVPPGLRFRFQHVSSVLGVTGVTKAR